VDLGSVAVVAVIAGLAGGAMGAALVGTVEGMLRRRQSHTDSGQWSVARRQFHGGAPFGDFNDRAKRVLALAQDEAQRFNHSYIGSEHLLLGLSREGDGVAARVLQSLDMTLPKLRRAVETTLGRGQDAVTTIELSDAAKVAIGHARGEAHKLGHRWISTEHLLLGLVGEHGAALSIMRAVDIEPEQVVHQVITALGQPEPVLRSERLDTDSRKVMTLARQEAIQNGHSYIGSENLAMALRLYSTPTLDTIWSQLAIDPETLRRRIEAAVPPILGATPTEGVATTRVSEILGLADRLAADRKRDDVPPELLLIALADEGGGAGARVLASFGATARRIREVVDRANA
jgi:ATP-dependent Clp protease ATP-binding subunit ClpA